MSSRRVRVLVLGGLLAAFGLAFAGIWAIPNVAGAAFVDVRAVASGVDSGSPAGSGESAGGSAASGVPTVLIGPSGPMTASAIEVSVEVGNRYPLPVVVGSDRVAFRAAVYRRTQDGRLVRVWAASAHDPGLEEASDSPASGDSANIAAVVAPGTSRHSIASGATAFPLRDPSGAAIPSGVYYLRVWAYGIASPIVPISVDGAADPLGVPGDLAAPQG